MKSTLVIVPGMRDHVEAHWQTWLAHVSPNSLSVPPLGREDLSLDLHVRALEHCVAQASEQVQLVAHSAGCITVAHWAGQSQLTARVQSAFLAAPPDLDTPLPKGYPLPAELDSGGWLPVPRIRLPFPTWVGLSENDPLGRLDEIERLAQDWDAQTLKLGAVGHLNPQFGFGPWPAVLNILQRLRVHQV